MNLSILYRGPLASCNYACSYCPFAKHSQSQEEQAYDRACLQRFVDFVISRKTAAISVLFTPWGEALIHPAYQSALATLSQAGHVLKAAIQTNLSCKLDWVEQCEKTRLAIWATYHPGEVPLDEFLEKCRILMERQVRFSVGVVGLKENFQAINKLRSRLPEEIYVWVNAYKREIDYYNADEIKALNLIDPLFAWNNQYHESLGRSCRAGANVISVDGEGVIRRCHFIKSPIGNIYDPDWEQCLQERPCSNSVCGCHIGYVHMDDLKLYNVFGDSVLERIPASWPNADFYPEHSYPKPEGSPY